MKTNTQTQKSEEITIKTLNQMLKAKKWTKAIRTFNGEE